MGRKSSANARRGGGTLLIPDVPPPYLNKSSFSGDRRYEMGLWGEPAESERELIRERTGEGRKRAMANGVRFGR